MGTCAYLREVALGASELWQCIDIPGNIYWLALCRERCHGRPLIVSAIYDSSHDKAQYVVDAITAHVPWAIRMHLYEAKHKDRWEQMLEADSLGAHLHLPETLEYLSLSRP